jgi:hypothetical protein
MAFVGILQTIKRNVISGEVRQPLLFMSVTCRRVL